MQSVFGMHDRARFNVFLYTTSPWDGTAYRPRIASMVENCVDVSAWSLRAIVDHIMQNEIHIRKSFSLPPFLRLFSRLCA